MVLILVTKKLKLSVIDHSSKTPLHAQVEKQMRKLIHMKKYKSGLLLPKEIELANKWCVSRNTIRQATNKLENEGLIVRKKGVGTRVAEGKTLSTGLDHWYSFTKEMQEKGIQVINLQLKVEWVKPGAKISGFFNANPEKQVLKLSKLKGEKSGQPIVLFESYFHPRIGIQDNDDFGMPLYDLLESRYGVVVARSRENISSQVAASVARKLQVAADFPLLFRERFVYDAGNRPVEYNIGYYRSDKFTYSIDIRKNQR